LPEITIDELERQEIIVNKIAVTNKKTKARNRKQKTLWIEPLDYVSLDTCNALGIILFVYQMLNKNK